MPSDGRQAHILAINDDQDLLDLYEELLAGEGYRVTTWGDVLPEPETIAALTPDLLLLDYLWERSDVGWELLEELRAHPATRYLPIILCTAAVRQLDEVRDHLAAMQVTVVPKPFDIDVLVQTVARVLGQDAVGTTG